MLRLRSIQTSSNNAVVLGLFALVLNSIFNLFFAGLFPSIGNIFVYISAIALGPLAGILSATIGTIPLEWYFGHNEMVFHTLLMVSVLGFVAKRYSKVPPFITALATWVFVLTPLYSYTAGYWNISIESALICDVAFCLIASFVLLNSSVWVSVAKTPRHVPFHQICSHTLTSIALLSLLVGVEFSVSSYPLGFTASLALVTAVTILPAFVGRIFARYIEDNVLYLSQASLSSSERSKTFSGLSTEHWRRKEQREVENRNSKGLWKKPNPSDLPEDNPSYEPLEIEKNAQGVAVIGKDGTIGFANRPFRQLLGINLNKIIGNSINAVGVKEQVLTAINALVDEALDKGEQRMREVKLQAGDGKLQFLEIGARVGSNNTDMLASSNGNGVIITVQDITNKRTIESHLLKAQKLESLGSLMNGIAHEFNNSLTAIAAQASIALQHSYNNETVSNALHSIIDYTRASGKTVRSLLDFAEQSPGITKNTNLQALIENRLGLLKKLVGEQYEITFNCNQEKIASNCNPNMLMQAVTNLILNARDAYSNEGTIEISLDTEEISKEATSFYTGAKPGQFARLKVVDHGIGMNRDVLAKAFDPMFSTHSSGGHSGLGLSIVYAITRAHDGFLTAESHPNKGTTISIYLPLVELEEQPEAENVIDFTEKRPYQQSTNANILVVEDEEHVRELTTFMLSEMGYNVKSCVNGNEALELAEQNSFDLVLLDYIIPKVAGLDLIEQLKEKNNQIKTLVMTGYGTHIDDEYSGEILEKPFDMDTLAKAVQEKLVEETISVSTQNHLHR